MNGTSTSATRCIPRNRSTVECHRQYPQVRMAYFETLRPAVIIEQTLEPAEIAGFNQFFDDQPGMQAKRYGIGIDQRFSESIYAGLEAPLGGI